MMKRWRNRVPPKGFAWGCLAVFAIAGPATGGEHVARQLPPSTDETVLRKEPFPGYDTLCGFPIRYASTAHVSLAIEDKRGAFEIILDPRLKSSDERFRRVFLAAHECAHRQLGHTSPAGLARRQTSQRHVLDQEMSADCWAAETLSRAGLENHAWIMAGRFYRAGPYSPGGGYPAGTQRAAIIWQCAAAGLSARLAADGTRPRLSTPAEPQ